MVTLLIVLVISQHSFPTAGPIRLALLSTVPPELTELYGNLKIHFSHKMRLIAENSAVFFRRIYVNYDDNPQAFLRGIYFHYVGNFPIFSFFFTEAVLNYVRNIPAVLLRSFVHLSMSLNLTLKIICPSEDSHIVCKAPSDRPCHVSSTVPTRVNQRAQDLFIVWCMGVGFSHSSELPHISSRLNEALSCTYTALVIGEGSVGKPIVTNKKPVYGVGQIRLPEKNYNKGCQLIPNGV